MLLIGTGWPEDAAAAGREIDDRVALHVNCSVKKTGSDAKLKKLLAACVDEIIEPAGVTCCGFAGDKGLFAPQLNAWATRFVKNDIPPDCAVGISTVSTCATGLSERAGIPFVSLASLLEYVSRPDGR